MKLFHFFRALALIAIIDVTAAVAETACRSEVSYKWKRAQAESDAVEHSITLEARGADEPTAKQNLAAQVAREKSRAIESCRERHENLTGCIAGRLSALAPTMQAMGFSQRKTIEDAVSADCTARQGKCGEAAATDPQCSEVIKASASSSAGDEKGGKKDEKGKKK